VGLNLGSLRLGELLRLLEGCQESQFCAARATQDSGSKPRPSLTQQKGKMGVFFVVEQLVSKSLNIE
jgi:hypothetical protein